MKKRKTRGIFASVFMSYSAVVVIVLALACLFSFNLVRTSVVDRHKVELLNKARLIANSVSKAPDWAVLKRYQRLIDARIVYLGMDQNAVYAPDFNVFEQDEKITLTNVKIETENDLAITQKLFESSGVTGVTCMKFLNQQIVYAGLPLHTQEGELLGALMVYRKSGDVDGIWYNIVKNMLMAALFAMGFVMVITTLLARGFTRPLLQMKGVATKMSDGDYSTRVTVYKNDEIGQLGQTLNVLSERLQNVIANLREEKCKLELVFMNMGEGVVACNARGEVLHVNEAALAFMEICRWNSDEDVPKQKNVSALLKKCMNTGGRETEMFINASGRAIALMATPMQNHGEDPIGAVCLIRDVSEEIRLEQRRREYIANVSHELRTPLTGIRGMIEPLIDGILESEEEKQENYRIIDKEAAHLEKMIGEMLELSRLQAGSVKAELEKIDVRGPVSSAVNAIRPIAEKAKIALQEKYEGDLTCMGMEDRIQQLIMILLDNATSFTPEGGSIYVTAVRVKAQVVITVKDTGTGIEPCDLPYIWERFYKADKSRMRTSGTGLGLAIAKCITEMLGASIEVNSELGKGSEFTVRLAAQN